MKKLKIYLDTSIINFLFADDAPELKAVTIEFFDNFIKNSIYETYVSEYVLLEINKTSDYLKKEKLLEVIEKYPIELLEITHEDDIELLANAYIQNNIIPANKKLDALHIAVSTVSDINFLVSWNYKHLANVNREKKIIAVNIQYNYLYPLRICTPLELIDYGS
jgi:predicted nucleic acid-binding protein